jgi:mono/diheme cytochrome c family protein
MSMLLQALNLLHEVGEVRVSKITIMAAAGALLLAGCGRPPEPQFSVNARAAQLIPEARAKIADVLKANFGSPNRLVAWQKLPIDYGEASSAPEGVAVPEAGWRLVEGRRLYMVHCLHCHGVAGDGSGPTARFLNPKPRDYRQGIFKFKSTMGDTRPTREDLERILADGIPGTYMPSFVLLGPERLGLLVDYVRWLSMRGEVETRLIAEQVANGLTLQAVDQTYQERRAAKQKSSRAAIQAELVATLEKEFEETAQATIDLVVDFWRAADDPASIVRPQARRTPPTPESIARGRGLFLSAKAKCSDCHGASARGDGPQTEQFEKMKDVSPERNYDHPGLHDAWGNLVSPRDLTRGIYRGGRRPIDIYRRIYSGINGTPMPGNKDALTEAEKWDVVNYVLSIPFDGRQSAAPDQVANADNQPAANMAAREKTSR